MADMLRKDEQPSARDAGDLIFRKLDRQTMGSNRKFASNESYDAIDKNAAI